MTGLAGPGPATPEPTVSVYIPSLNTAAATELCIRSLRRFAGRPFTLHVGDCGSTDGTLALLRQWESSGRLRLEVAPGGRFHADWLDHWLATCTDTYAVFVDSDIEFLRPGWLRDLVEAARASAAAVVAAEFLDEIPIYQAPRAGLDPADRAEMLRRWFGGHEQVRLASRPAPWLLLVDVAMVRALGATFAFHLDDSHPDDVVAMDVGGSLFRDVVAGGLPWRVMPASFGDSYHHYGGLSWVPLKGRRGLKKRRDLLVVRRRLLRARRRDRALDRP